MQAILEAIELAKDYRQVKAVNGVSFELQGGICFGLLGPNGAGKTTTVEMLEGIIRPDSGSILYKGKPIGSRFQNEAGIMFQNTALQEFITCREALNLFKGLYPSGLSIESLQQRCALEDFLDRDTRKLSGGQRQRLLLAIALINDPEIVFLDEPTTGLDPQARRNFWNLVQDIKSQGTAVLLTTHYMEEAYTLCDEIAIMDRGKIIAQGTPRDLLEKHFNDVILQVPKKDWEQQQSELTGQHSVFEQDDWIEIVTRDVDVTIRALLDAGIHLANLEIRPRTLDDLFLELTGKELRA